MEKTKYLSNVVYVELSDCYNRFGYDGEGANIKAIEHTCRYWWRFDGAASLYEMIDSKVHQYVMSMSEDEVWAKANHISKYIDYVISKSDEQMTSNSIKDVKYCIEQYYQEILKYNDEAIAINYVIAKLDYICDILDTESIQAIDTVEIVDDILDIITIDAHTQMREIDEVIYNHLLEQYGIDVMNTTFIEEAYIGLKNYLSSIAKELDEDDCDDRAEKEAEYDYTVEAIEALENVYDEYDYIAFRKKYPDLLR